MKDMKVNWTRRNMMKGAAMLAMPAIVGRAPVVRAQSSFAGESLIVVSWSGNHELSVRKTVVEPFNEKHGTKVETVGGWDQMVNQITAAPADNPPFDITIADEYTTSTGLAEGLFVETDRAKIPGFEAVLPWFDEMRGAAKSYGVPFGGGSLWMLASRKSDVGVSSWRGFWDPKALGKTTMDAAAFYWDLCIPALLSDRKPGIDEVFDSPAEMEPLFAEIEKLKMAKWYKDGAELANLITQESAEIAMLYSADAFGFMENFGDSHELGIPGEGTASYTNWFMKVRGTRHSELSDLFLGYLLQQDTQQRFLDASTDFMSRSDLRPPTHWPSYPTTNDAVRKAFSLFSLEGWNAFGANWEVLDARMKDTISRTTSG